MLENIRQRHAPSWPVAEPRTACPAVTAPRDRLRAAPFGLWLGPGRSSAMSAERLTGRAIRALKRCPRSYKRSDGRGLYLEVVSAGNQL